MAKQSHVSRAQKKKVPKRNKTADTLETPVESESLLARVKKESVSWRPGRGVKREIARMAFALWLSIPVRYRGAPESVLKQLGLDGDMLELAQIGTSGEFGEKCNVQHQALADWRKEILDGDEGKDQRAFFRGLMKEGLGALYRKLIETGDADKFKVFAQYVEDWMPGMRVFDPTNTAEVMDPAEKAKLDKLVERNSVKI